MTSLFDRHDAGEVVAWLHSMASPPMKFSQKDEGELNSHELIRWYSNNTKEHYYITYSHSKITTISKGEMHLSLEVQSFSFQEEGTQPEVHISSTVHLRGRLARVHAV
jgi:hypothetical protein